MGLMPDCGLRMRRECRKRFPSPPVSNPDMHHGTCVTHVPWCMPRSLTSTSGFLWSRRGKHSRHSRRMRNPQFNVTVKGPTVWAMSPTCTTPYGTTRVQWVKKITWYMVYCPCNFELNGFCAGNSPGTGELRAQMISNPEFRIDSNPINKFLLSETMGMNPTTVLGKKNSQLHGRCD